MAMTLRLTDEDTRRLRAQAEREGQSMHEVALSALRDRFADHDVRREQVRGQMVARYSGAFDRLADL